MAKRIVAVETIIIGSTAKTAGVQFNPGDEFKGVRPAKVAELLKQGLAMEVEDPEPDLVEIPGEKAVEPK